MDVAAILTNTAPCPLAFIHRPGLPPRSNGSERTARSWAAIVRK